ncbi:hypothetical protein HYC85_001376 [Camellia sinensis]|uniref:Uncharacterized protein n=1 Tax=Camellia sinensis TaxID=4442 RepID=A0A7J7I6H4_CAMSI|nr:hypothetical protein HYC85_001376 [Camellia sinensis]
MMRSSPQHDSIPSMKFRIPDKLTAVDFSTKYRSRSSTTISDLFVVCNKRSLRSESSDTFDKSIS